MTTDVHAHVLLPALQAEVERRAPEAFREAAALDARRNGPESLAASGRMIGERFPLLTDAGARLAAMDRQGVDRQWVSASPSHFYPWAGEDLAVWIATEANRMVAEHVANAPDRLTGLGLVPLQHPGRLVECLDDAMLKRGMAGVEISSFAGDVELSDPRLEPFWSRAGELGAIVFLHPFGCSLDERLDRYYLSNTVGQPTENAVALSHLIFSGVLDRHPGLKIVAAHGGGYLPTAIGRSNHAWRVRPEAHGCAHEPSSYLQRIWFDTVVHDPRALAHLVEAAGASRVLMGSDFPFDMGPQDPVAEVRNAGLPAAATEQILSGNAEALLAGQVRPAQQVGA
ncbi:aminocarboxymuconate-semialdehyde decarboxylase [Pseudarthrobacter enclensis]|uniref:Amidohydrolase n=1 Tax=Pseudarthrobacter enclensis TaxID=993070 RepID=A0A0V8IQM9_9MICC|nr:amidohydrolase family protein [Pseudarthrobacter enclensis]KSU76816.1 amidohydrolase [Pseudarthrobacter enclensis]SCC03166.1 aminocarboxymuconate-semialdehyde decarboxylase [Pseudarthrobacter enclensis]